MEIDRVAVHGDVGDRGIAKHHGGRRLGKRHDLRPVSIQHDFLCRLRGGQRGACQPEHGECGSHKSFEVILHVRIRFLCIARLSRACLTMQINGECPLNGYLAKEDHLIVWSHDLTHQEVMVFKYF